MIVQIMGRLGSDPEMRFTPTGEAVTNMSVCEDSKWTDKDGKEHKKLWWFRCSAWGGRAETLNKYFHKGDGIYLIGELIADEKGNPRTFKRQDNTIGASYELRIKEFRFLPNKREENGTPAYEAPEQGLDDVSEDDLGFTN